MDLGEIEQLLLEAKLEFMPQSINEDNFYDNFNKNFNTKSFEIQSDAEEISIPKLRSSLIEVTPIEASHFHVIRSRLGKKQYPIFTSVTIDLIKEKNDSEMRKINKKRSESSKSENSYKIKI